MVAASMMHMKVPFATLLQVVASHLIWLHVTNCDTLWNLYQATAKGNDNHTRGIDNRRAQIWYWHVTDMFFLTCSVTVDGRKINKRRMFVIMGGKLVKNIMVHDIGLCLHHIISNIAAYKMNEWSKVCLLFFLLVWTICLLHMTFNVKSYELMLLLINFISPQRMMCKEALHAVTPETSIVSQHIFCQLSKNIS